MSRQSLLAVVGARPNYVKTAPVLASLGCETEVRLVHTGQHYDSALADGFIQSLGMRPPEVNLNVGSGSHGEQTSEVMRGVERELERWNADAVLVVGDVNSTMAAALAAAKCEVPVLHIESGLRSHDFSMPEEVNRVVTDRVAELLLCHCRGAVENLAAEGRDGGPVRLVGNTMIDSLFRIREAVDPAPVLASHGLEPRNYCLVTLHRPALVDRPADLAGAFGALDRIAEDIPVLVPVHPRTRARLDSAGVRTRPGVRAIEPLEYDQFVALMAEARVVITDSGGIQEETSALGVPCLTYRDSTERPITVSDGTNRLVGRDPDALVSAVRDELESDRVPETCRIPLWDGEAGPRAAVAIREFMGSA